MTTISLELDDELAGRLREMAAARNVSLAEMAHRLLQVRSGAEPKANELGTLTRAATGIAPPMTDDEVREALDEYRMRKYGGE
jgi:hypothetical protein